MTFDDFFIKYHGLAKPEWMNDHRIYMKEAWEAALNKGTPAEQTGNSQSVAALKYVEERLSILQNPDAIIKKNVDWYYAVQLCKDIIQRLNAEAALHT